MPSSYDMKIQLLSDLRNEFYRQEALPPIVESEAEVVVLAGDIDVGLSGLQWAVHEADRLGKTVLYVAGNHEFYHHDIGLLDEMRAFAADCAMVHFLENDEFIVGNVRFLGCTLWTDYKAAGDPVLSMLEVKQHLNDHHIVRNGDRLFLPEDALRIHRKSKSWLAEKQSQPFEGKTIVITHHAPHMLCAHPSYPMNAIGTAFLSDLGGMVEKADVWCFGHTHANLDVKVGKCRLVSNQKGYPMEEVKVFDPAFVISVG